MVICSHAVMMIKTVSADGLLPCNEPIIISFPDQCNSYFSGHKSKPPGHYTAEDQTYWCREEDHIYHSCLVRTVSLPPRAFPESIDLCVRSGCMRCILSLIRLSVADGVNRKAGRGASLIQPHLNRTRCSREFAKECTSDLDGCDRNPAVT